MIYFGEKPNRSAYRRGIIKSYLDIIYICFINCLTIWKFYVIMAISVVSYL
jgi:hypothetical protein